MKTNKPNQPKKGSYQSSEIKTNQVQLIYFYHKEMHCIGLHFTCNSILSGFIKNIEGSKYSSSQKCYYLKYEESTFKQLIDIFKMGGIYPDYRGFFQNMEAHSKNQVTNKANKNINPEPTLLCEESNSAIELFTRYLQQKRYGTSTIKTYKNALTVFLTHTKKKPEEIRYEDLELFNHEYILKYGYSTSYQNQVVNAIKLYFEKYQNNHLDITKLERPRKSSRLPKVIDKNNVEKLLKSITNKKHQIALTLIYELGLRSGELINLKLKDINGTDRTVIIRQAKGAKDRILPISEKMLIKLRNYYTICKPKTYLIEGEHQGMPYSQRSLSAVFRQNCDRVFGKGSFVTHSLRHSFATHNMDAGVDLRFIQEMLGHKSSKTTEIYTHVSMRSLKNIKSLTDDFDI